MPRWVGLLGSWALLVLAIGIVGYAVAAEAITMTDSKKLQRVKVIDSLIAEQKQQQIANLQKSISQASSTVTNLQSELATTEQQIQERHDTNFVITVSTEENKIYARDNGKLVFEAVCSTGKGTTLTIGGRTMIFNTPVGRFHVVSKEDNPTWVPPDWHYVEQARKEGLEVERLQPGQCISDVCAHGHEVYAGGSTVDEGAMIVRGGALIIPPVGTRAREFSKVLGKYRLNLGDGYAIHGTQETSKLGQSVSHGCVRVGDDDLERLYSMAHVGDEVIIY